MFSCSQCDFTANFESALEMHRQLHHGIEAGPLHKAEQKKTEENNLEKTIMTPRDSSPTTSLSPNKVKGLKLASRTSSATRILGKLRARICRSKIMSIHHEDPLNMMLTSDFSCRSDCTSKAMKLESPSRTLSPVREDLKETYACHLCHFNADRITVLDRHLLNDHKIGLDKLLKLVLAKTKDGLSDDSPPEMFGIRQPYYRTNDDTMDEEEFLIETNNPKIRTLKHASTNTDLTWSDIPDLKDNCRMITNELDKLIKCPARIDKDDLLDKMQILNDYMCKFVDSSNTLKRALSRDIDGKYSRREKMGPEETRFELRLEEPDTPRSTRGRDWDRAHSEKSERYRTKHSDKFRCEKAKLSADSFYF